MDVKALEAEIMEKVSGGSGEVLDRVEGSELEDYMRSVVRNVSAMTDENATLSFILYTFRKKYTEQAIRDYVKKLLW